MRIGELAARTDVSTDTLRLYEKRGLIASVRRVNGYRDFDVAMVRLVRLVRLGQRLGFKLREMEDLVGAVSAGALDETETAALLHDKLSEVDAKIGELSQLRGLLSDILGQACPLQT